MYSCPALKDENDLFRQIFYRNGADLCLFPPCQTSQILPRHLYGRLYIKHINKNVDIK